MKNKFRHSKILAGILVVVLIFVIGSGVANYSITPSEAYFVGNINTVDDGSFELFNKESGDCCRSDGETAIVSASKSGDSVDGAFSLKLTSSNRCACVNFPITSLDNSEKYLLSFYYKGTNPRMCNWVNDDKKCMPEIKMQDIEEWQSYKTILKFSNSSVSSLVHFYADSRDGKTYTNFYDDLQVRKLIQINDPSKYSYGEKEYIIKTKADNVVNGEMISEVDAESGEAYFIVQGEPSVTVQFPWSEVAIIIIIMLVIVRLLFKKNDEKVF